jgi:hypothetical protein
MNCHDGSFDGFKFSFIFFVPASACTHFGLKEYAKQHHHEAACDVDDHFCMKQRERERKRTIKWKLVNGTKQRSRKD